MVKQDTAFETMIKETQKVLEKSPREQCMAATLSMDKGNLHMAY